MRRGTAIWLGVVAVCASAAVSANPGAPAARTVVAEFPPAGPFRLPHTFEPKHYRARIALGDGSFEGHIEIEGELSANVSLIWLHGADLVASRAVATRGNRVVPLLVSRPRGDQLLGLSPAQPLTAGPWTISIDYRGTIGDLPPPQKGRYGVEREPEQLGVFRRSVDGKTYVFTQSEAIGARKIFPCIDEPDRKVPWQLTLDMRAELVAASNTPIIRETLFEAGRKRVEFAETRPLPSYLIAFAAGPFEIVDAGKTKEGTPVRVLALSGHQATVAVAARAAPGLIERISAWLDVPYAYGKLDIVTVPHLGFGAMENPGLITMSQGAIESTHSPEILAHELAHQWFGDLVTPAWWDDLWLNESFAELVAKHFQPGPGDLLSDRAAVRQALDHGGAIRRAPERLDDLSMQHLDEFRAIWRGTALLSAIEAHLGEQRLRSWLHAYLVAHLDGTVTSSDLLHALRDVAGTGFADTVSSLLDAPTAELETSLVCDGPARVHVKGARHPTEVCVAYERDGQRDRACAIISDASPDLPLPAKSCPKWFMPNADGAGLYSVAWQRPLVENLFTNAWPKLTANEKRALFEDVDDAALKFTVFTHLLAAHDEAANDPVYLAELARYVPSDLRARFDTYVQQRFHATSEAVRFDGTSDEVIYAPRGPAIVQLLAATLDPRLTQQALLVVAKHPNLDDQTPYGWVVLALAANADHQVRDKLFELALNRRPWEPGVEIGAVSGIRDLVAIVKADPAKRGLLKQPMMFFNRPCDPSERTDVEALLTGTRALPAVLHAIDACLAKRAAVEPQLRAWLTAMGPDTRKAK